MAKKKKPSANPARGVATVSLPRRTKEAENPTSSAVDMTETENGSPASPSVVAASTPAPVKADEERELHELSPEELEARLDESELQGLVDKFAAKSQRDASRQVGKLQAECRILRAQAQPLATRPLLSDLAIKQILDLAAKDLEERAVRVDQLSLRRALQEEEAIGRLWTLQRTLLGLGFHEQQIHAALRHVLKLSTISEDSGSVWGLEEAMDWLAVKYPAEELPSYDTTTGKSLMEKVETEEPTALNLENTAEQETRNGSKLSFRKTAKCEAPSEPASTSSQLNIEVSDLESDLEPDELLSQYLATKQKLYEIQPEIFRKNDRNGSKKQNTDSGMIQQSSTHPAVMRLQQKLQRIEADLLFDDQEADSQWSRRVIELARDTADRRQLQLPPSTTPAKVSRPPPPPPPPIVPASPAFTDNSESSSDESGSDGDDALANLFASSSEHPPTSNPSLNPVTNGSDADQNIIIRDFGPSKGVTARRILDEACRARYGIHSLVRCHLEENGDG